MSLKLQILADFVGCEIDGDPHYLIDGTASLKSATSKSLAFYADPRQRSDLKNTNAGAIVLQYEAAGHYSGNKLIVSNPYLVFTKLSGMLNPEDEVVAGIAEGAVIHPSAEISTSAHISPGCVIGADAVIGDKVTLGAQTSIGVGVTIGDESRLDTKTTIYKNSIIGKRCQIASGAVIGSRGFGYLPENNRWLEKPQLGRVVIGDDVDVGANTTIDRGSLDDTIIGDGVKMDNLIQIAHNVIIGEYTVMAAFVGIAGSTKIGKHCQIGGRASIQGHISIADHVTINATSFVSTSINEPGAIYSSAIPAKPVSGWRRIVARLNRIDNLATRLKALEKTHK